VSDDVRLAMPGHPRWLPIPLEGDPDEAAAALVDDLLLDLAGGETSADFRNDTVAMVAGTSRLVRRQADELRATGLLTYAAWMLLPAPYLLMPGPVATLRLRDLLPGTTDDEVVAAATDLERERHGPVDVDVLEDTAAGRALSVRYRPVVRLEDGTSAVDEHRVVLWPHPEASMTMELHLFSTDLVEAGRAAGPLLELARAIEWQVG
jgi:hypothetical protein